MKYAKWATEKEIASGLDKIDIKQKIARGGIPILWKGNTPYIDYQDGHTLLIGSIGSGKTQTIILPYIKISMLAGESMLINDYNGEIYSKLASKLKEEGYKSYVLNFENPRVSASFNPLGSAYRLYQEKKADEALKFLEITANSFFYEEKGVDPFWNNTAISLFIGLSLYLFTNAKLSEINLNSLYYLASELIDNTKCEEFLTKLEKNSQIYILLQSILNSPYETRASIISVFNSTLKEYISRSDLAKLLAHDDFSLFEVLKEKIVIFINNSDNQYSENLTSLFLNQVYLTQKLMTKKRKINVILDNFDEFPPIKDFAKMLNLARSNMMKFLVVAKGYTNLLNIYGNYFNIIKMCFANIIYLWTNDLVTLEELSKLCGEAAYHEPLVSIEELKQLKKFEAIILLPRSMPFKTKLIPDYQLDWGYKEQEIILPEYELLDFDIYKLN